jgi:LPXTG-motif cell wall-anchored protein
MRPPTTVLAFAPGAWTPLHSHGGLTLVAVLEGAMSVRSGGRETVYGPGDVWIEQPGDVHAAGNMTAAEGQVAVTFLLRRGDPVTTVAAAQAPVQLPRGLPSTGDANGPMALTAVLGTALLGGRLYRRRRLGGG